MLLHTQLSTNNSRDKFAPRDGCKISKRDAIYPSDYLSGDAIYPGMLCTGGQGGAKNGGCQICLDIEQDFLRAELV